MHRIALTDEELEELRGMVEGWIDEGFTTPPYTVAQYAVFAKLGLPPEAPRVYDISPRSARIGGEGRLIGRANGLEYRA